MRDNAAISPTNVAMVVGGARGTRGGVNLFANSTKFFGHSVRAWIKECSSEGEAAL